MLGVFPCLGGTLTTRLLAVSIHVAGPSNGEVLEL